MTLSSAFIPLVFAVVAALVLTGGHRRLPPVFAARVLVASLTVVAVAALASVWILTVAWLAHLPLLSGRLDWCHHLLGGHDHVPVAVGLPALIFSVVGLVRVVRVVTGHRRLCCDGAPTVDVTDDAQPFACTLPGSAGRVIVSTGLLELLDEEEQSVVLAHEHVHGTHRHDRMLLLARLAQACLPVLGTLTGRLRFCLERWADEEAAARLGADRRFVARTLAKVALQATPPAATLDFAGLGVPARVAALLRPRPVPVRRAAAAAVWLAIASTGLVAGYQLHHLVVFVDGLCRT